MTPKKPSPAKKKSAAPDKAKGAAKAAKSTAKKPATKAAATAPVKKATASPKAESKAAKAAPKSAKKPAEKPAPAKAVAAKASAVKTAAPKESPAKSVAPASKAAATKAKAPVAAKPVAPVKEAAPAKGKASAVKKLLAGKSVKPVKPSTKAAPVPAEPKVLSSKEKLAKLLALRAADAKLKSREAAEELRRGTGSTVPSSVHKAAEFAETRKISSILKSGKRGVREVAPAAPVKKQKKRKAPYSKAELRELKDILESERTRLLRDLAVMNEIATSSEENMSRSFSNHQADAATDSSALETTFVTRRYEEERLSQVTRALERLETGTYGLCEMCADELQKRCETCPFIPIGRLRAKPFAILCLPLRQDLEKKNRR